MGPAPALIFTNVEKQYGGLRPLRVRDLRIAVGAMTMLVGFDRPAAETFINLTTGSTLPDSGDVVALGRPTRDIADSTEWLSFVEQFGIVSDRVVLLDAMTTAQNLAMSFDLELDPVPAPVMERVVSLAREVGIDAAMLDVQVGNAPSLVQARVRLARALALEPLLVILEHPTASLAEEDARRYAQIIASVAEKRNLTTVGLTADERFAKNTNGRLLVWQPATGDFREQSGRKFWPFF